MNIEHIKDPADWNCEGWEINRVTLDIDLAPKSRPQMLADMIAAYARKVYLGPWPMAFTVYLDGRWWDMQRHQDGRIEILGVAGH